MIPGPPPYHYNVHHAQYINQERRKEEARRAAYIDLEERTEPMHYEQPKRFIASEPSYTITPLKEEMRPLVKVLAGICTAGTLASLVATIYCTYSAFFNKPSEGICGGAIISFFLMCGFGMAAGELTEKLKEKK